MESSEEEQEVSVIDYVKDELLNLNNVAWQAIDVVMRRISEEVGCTPKELHKAFKQEEGMIPDQWLEENIEKELCGYMPLDEAVLHRAGNVYELSMMWRG